MDDNHHTNEERHSDNDTDLVIVAVQTEQYMAPSDTNVTEVTELTEPKEPNHTELSAVESKPNHEEPQLRPQVSKPSTTTESPKQTEKDVPQTHDDAKDESEISNESTMPSSKLTTVIEAQCFHLTGESEDWIDAPAFRCLCGLWCLAIIAVCFTGFGQWYVQSALNDEEFESNCVDPYDEDVAMQKPNDEFRIVTTSVGIMVLLVICMCYVSSEAVKHCIVFIGIIGAFVIASLLIHIFIYVDLLNQAFAEASPTDCYIHDTWEGAYDMAYAGVWAGSCFFGLILCFCCLSWYASNTSLRYLGFEVNISDENNRKRYQELKAESATIQTKASALHSVALLSPWNVPRTDQRCDLPNCQHIKGLCATLLSYHARDNDEEIFDDNYTIRTALDDFHHLLFDHDQQFENIHNTFVEECLSQDACSLDECLIARAHYSQQSVRSNADRSVLRERVEQETLRKIHCYYFHSFDIGYRLRSRDRQTLLEGEHKHDPQSDNSFDRISTSRALEFVTANHKNRKLTRFDRIETRNTKFKSDTQQLVRTYDDCIRYSYWLYYKDNNEKNDVALIRGDLNPGARGARAANDGYSVGQWYIEQKYDDLKQESLNNETCSMSAGEYALFMEQAVQHHQTLVVKSLTARGRAMYGIEDGTSIAVEHLLAMMIYCNKDVLQAKFSETFRRRENESDEELIARHREFANLGRLLREFVECFGQTGIGNREVSEKQLYHGISTEMQFDSIMICLKGPVSTTVDYCVALNFALSGSDSSEGLILQFSLSEKWIIPSSDNEYGGVVYEHDDNRCAFVDCHWLSAYPQEQERFFIGGYGYFYFENIYEVKSNNYMFYIQAMRLISETLQLSQKLFGRSLGSSLDQQIALQMAFRLLSHELHKCHPDHEDYHALESIPPYVDELFHNYCTNTRELSFYNFAGYDHKIAFDHGTMKRMFESIFFYDNGLMKWPIVASIFPSLDKIVIEANCNGEEVEAKNLEMIRKDEFWISLAKFLRRRNKPQITIDLSCHAPTDQCLDVFESKKLQFGELFRQIQWNFIYAPKHHLLIIDPMDYSLVTPLSYETEGQSSYEVLRAVSKDNAYKYLESRIVTLNLYYVEVETPEGTFGKDNSGIYDKAMEAVKIQNGHYGHDLAAQLDSDVLGVKTRTLHDGPTYEIIIA
eukprot:269317_1